MIDRMAAAAIQLQAPLLMRSELIRFSVPGKPLGKGRPRFSRASGRAFTPAKTVSYEGKIALFAREAMGERPPFEAGVPLSVSVKAVFDVPVSWSKRRRVSALAGAMHTGRPDLDNIGKCIGDAGNGVLWHDDSSIARLLIVKCYGPVAELVVEVERMIAQAGTPL